MNARMEESGKSEFKNWEEIGTGHCKKIGGFLHFPIYLFLISLKSDL